MALRRLVLCLTMLSCTAAAQDSPPLPFIDEGVCPYEYCGFGTWEARESFGVLTKAEVGAPEAVRLIKGSCFEASTGFIKVTKSGALKVLKPVKHWSQRNAQQRLEALELKPGDVMHVLYRGGEGIATFWFKGRVYADELWAPIAGWDTPNQDYQVLSEPKWEWWVKVTTKDGKMGWAKDPPVFHDKYPEPCGKRAQQGVPADRPRLASLGSSGR